MQLMITSYEETLTNGKVLIVDVVFEERKEGERDMSRRFGFLFDVAMIVYTMGGKERIEEEFKRVVPEGRFQQLHHNQVYFISIAHSALQILVRLMLLYIK